ncbi:hypothetical protein PVK06_038229 [Gossypium arboreum]|uniref:Zinc knuckle CX2CX4HX4C domain-containing protein n=1 Tax=Gossypium arboreum TaxID=29729 RepID=A0ABR0MZK6_GOSAR|nr:hypothetical protein PVK06_038229 [Gossypium arboreum]
MAKQFGNFLGQFLEYDTSIPTMGIKKFMHIRIRLNVTILLKRKKKVQIGKNWIVYAYFQYEKLSLFCFICGKIDHGESFCPFRTRNELSKIVFGWDISLHAVVRRWNTIVNKWLCEDCWIWKETLKAEFQINKRQRVVGDATIFSGNNIEGGLHDITASSAVQSNRMQ